MCTDRDIRAMFRGAVVAGILDGWYVPGFGTAWCRYIVAPVAGATVSYTLDEAGQYCDLLAEAGVEPRYRASEPVL